MKTWFYRDGEWKRIEDPFDGAFDYVDDDIARVGFDETQAMRFGDMHGFFVLVHEALEGVEVETGDGTAGADFLVLVRTPHRVYPVFVGDLPDLVRLLGELRPTIAGENEASEIDEIEDGIRSRR